MKRHETHNAPVETALIAALNVIANTHGNGYGHWNPWEECDSPMCVKLRKSIQKAGMELRRDGLNYTLATAPMKPTSTLA